MRMIEACNLIDQMQISQQNQYLRQDDTLAKLSASLYEYLLNKLSAAGQEEFVPYRRQAGVVARAVTDGSSFAHRVEVSSPFIGGSNEK